uniref:Uncharacterized protein n=1 Tax=Octopus bimaculoides TaxID=37653 RepID=A0A0L8FQF2_OCTBM
METGYLTLALSTGQKGPSCRCGHIMEEDREQRPSCKEEGIRGLFQLPPPKERKVTYLNPYQLDRLG